MKTLIVRLAPAGFFVLLFIAAPAFGRGVAKSSQKARSKGEANPSTLTTREIFRRSAGEHSGDIFLRTTYGSFVLEDRDFEESQMRVSHYSGGSAGKANHQKTVALPPHAISMHGYAWDYDLRIPIAFWEPAPKYLRKGQYPGLAIQQDIAPTLAAILGIPPPSMARGRVLREALLNSTKEVSKRPKAIIVFVQDQMGRIVLKTHSGRAPFYEKVMKEGANFFNGSVSHVDVETSVGHAAIGTGAFPPQNMIGANRQFNTGTWGSVAAFNLPLANGKTQEGYSGFYLAPTLSDTWLASRGGKPKVLALAAAGRAAIAMGGHGSMFKGGSKAAVVWTGESSQSSGQYITDTEVFELPKAFKDKVPDQFAADFAKEVGGKWYDHEVIDASGRPNLANLIASPVLPRFESSMIIEAVPELGIGQDDETDLMWVNMKSTDYCGHYYGFESDECGDVLQDVDRAVTRIVETVDKATGGDYLVVFTADHGCAPLPELSGAVRYTRQKLIKAINEKFDHKANNLDVVLYLTSSQLYINRQELAFNGHTMEEVVQFLKNFEIPMEKPYNSMADVWLKKGKKAKQRLFEEVILKEDL